MFQQLYYTKLILYTLYIYMLTESGIQTFIILLI